VKWHFDVSYWRPYLVVSCSEEVFCRPVLCADQLPRSGRERRVCYRTQITLLWSIRLVVTRAHKHASSPTGVYKQKQKAILFHVRRVTNMHYTCLIIFTDDSKLLSTSPAHITPSKSFLDSSSNLRYRRCIITGSA